MKSVLKYILVNGTVWEIDEKNQRVCPLTYQRAWFPFGGGYGKGNVQTEIKYWKGRGYSNVKEISREEALIILL